VGKLACDPHQQSEGFEGGGSKNIPELQKYDDLICYPVLVIEGLFGH